MQIGVPAAMDRKYLRLAYATTTNTDFVFLLESRSYDNSRSIDHPLTTLLLPPSSNLEEQTAIIYPPDIILFHPPIFRP